MIYVGRTRWTRWSFIIERDYIFRRFRSTGSPYIVVRVRGAFFKSVVTRKREQARARVRDPGRHARSARARVARDQPRTAKGPRGSPKNSLFTHQPDAKAAPRTHERRLCRSLVALTPASCGSWSPALATCSRLLWHEDSLLRRAGRREAFRRARRRRQQRAIQTHIDVGIHLRIVQPKHLAADRASRRLRRRCFASVHGEGSNRRGRRSS